MASVISSGRWFGATSLVSAPWVALQCRKFTRLIQAARLSYRHSVRLNEARRRHAPTFGPAAQAQNTVSSPNSLPVQAYTSIGPAGAGFIESARNATTTAPSAPRSRIPAPSARAIRGTDQLAPFVLTLRLCTVYPQDSRNGSKSHRELAHLGRRGLFVSQFRNTRWFRLSNRTI
jgi:hypothetical protein